MDTLNYLNRFSSLCLKDKFHFFDTFNIYDFKEYEAKELSTQFKSIVLNAEENVYLRKRSLECMLQLFFIEKIKKRTLISLLLDDWIETNHEYLEVTRIKLLFLFHSEEPQEIEEILEYYSNSSFSEIKSESLFQLGCITLNRALKNTESSINRFEESLKLFKLSICSIENQINANYFINLIETLIFLEKKNFTAFENKFSILKKLFLEKSLYSYENLNSIYIGILRCLNAMSLINKESLVDSLDYRASFEKISYYYYEIKNQELKDSLLQNLSQNIIKSYLEPFFLINIEAQKGRIEKRLAELNTDSQEYDFLTYLLNLLSEPQKIQVTKLSYIENNLLKLFPNVSETKIKSTILERQNALIENTAQELFRIYENFSEKSSENLLDSLIGGAIQLQGNKIYWTAHENDRNTFIKSLLTAQGYTVKDQTLWSKSKNGKAAGEIDLFIETSNNIPFSIIEALNLKSLDKSYLNLHIDKLFEYDVNGLKNNFIIVYYEGNNLSSFWTKYKIHIESYSFKYDLEEVIDISEPAFTDIKILKSKHLRTCNIVNIIHLIINIPN